MRARITSSLIIGTACAALAAQAPAPAGPRHVVLVTIDGMRGDYLGQADRYHLKIPNLRRLIGAGSVSERTLSVFPTLTGTAHTSLITGVTARLHGILGNNRFDPSVWAWAEDNYDKQPPYREYAWIKVETLWSVLRARGLKTAAIGWPQTFDGPIDYRLDVIPASTTAESHARTSRSASPGWLGAIEAKMGPIGALDARMADHYKALVAAEVLKQLGPSFMALHFALTDAAQHANGPGTPAALAAMEETDGNLGIVLAAVADGGLADRTAILVTGDHGFLNLHTQLAINLPLAEAGLIRRGPGDRPDWRAIIAPNRGLGSLYVKVRQDAEVAARARQALERYVAEYPRRFRILERSELDAVGADADAVLGVEPYPGYVLDARLAPPFQKAHNRAAGHGYRPDTPGMETGLIIAGAGARAGVVLPLTSTIDVAPTIAQLLGVALAKAEGKAIVGALR